MAMYYFLKLMIFGYISYIYWKKNDILFVVIYIFLYLAEGNFFIFLLENLVFGKYIIRNFVNYIDLNINIKNIIKY